MQLLFQVSSLHYEYQHDDVVADSHESNGPTPQASQAGTRTSTQCWPGPCSGGICAAGPVDSGAAGQADVHVQQAQWPGCAAGPGPGLSGSTAVQSPAAGQGGNSKAVALKSGLTQSCQPEEGLDT